MSQRRSLAIGRPPLAVSPRRLRPRLNTRSSVVIQSTPPCSKTQMSVRTPNSGKTPVRREFQVINSDILAMAKLVKAELGSPHDLTAALSPTVCTAAAGGPRFERGRFYDVYSARRNERLKRKQMETSEEAAALAQDPSVAVEIGKRRVARLQAEASVRKSMPPNFSAARASAGAGVRSSLRSSKEMKKSAAASASLDHGSAARCVTARRVVTRSSLRRL